MREDGPSKEWADAVKQLASNKTDRRFLNDSIRHAKIIADAMILPAKDGVDIYSGSLTFECYKDALTDITCSVRVLVDDLEAAAWAKNKPNFFIRKAPTGTGPHFFTVDGTGFRYELDHLRAIAVANFFEPKTCEVLKRRFNSAWDKGTEF